MASVFTMIIKGDLPGHFVWRDDRCVAFLSINPLSDGHTLVVPIEEVDHWLDLSPDLAAHLTTVAQTIGKAQQLAMPSARTGLIIAGFEVPHTHLHVMPVDHMGQMDFATAAAAVDHAVLAAQADDIRASLRTMGYPQAAD